MQQCSGKHQTGQRAEQNAFPLSHDEQVARAHPRFLNNNVPSSQTGAELLDRRVETTPFEEPVLWGQPQENNAWHREARPKHEIAEILVCQESHAVLSG